MSELPNLVNLLKRMAFTRRWIEKTRRKKSKDSCVRISMFIYRDQIEPLKKVADKMEMSRNKLLRFIIDVFLMQDELSEACFE